MGSFWTRDLTHVSCIDRWNLYPRAIREAPLSPFLKVPSWLSACLSPHGYSLQWQGVSAQTTSFPLLRLPLSCLPHSWSFCFIFLLPSCIGNLPPAIATLPASSWVFEITMVFHCVLSVARSELWISHSPSISVHFYCWLRGWGEFPLLRRGEKGHWEWSSFCIVA